MRTISTLFLFGALLLAAAVSGGCRKPEPVVLHCYCGEIFWNLMQEETLAFHRVYGVQIVLLPILPPKTEEAAKSSRPTSSQHAPIPWRSRPKIRSGLKPDAVELDPGVSQLISSLNADGRADMYLTDAMLQIGRLEDSSMIAHRYPFCYLSMSLLVAKGNPKNIKTVAGLFAQKARLGIMDSDKDGMGMTALETIAIITADIPEETVKSQLQQFSRHAELLEALETGSVDAVLVWNSLRPADYLLKKYAPEYAENLFKDPIEKAKKYNSVEPMNRVLEEMFAAILAEKEFTDRVELTANDEDREGIEESRTIEISLVTLGRTLHDGHCRRFADFLISPEGRAIMRRHGFAPK